jgi:hypothetical protein
LWVCKRVGLKVAQMDMMTEKMKGLQMADKMEPSWV